MEYGCIGLHKSLTKLKSEAATISHGPVLGPKLNRKLANLSGQPIRAHVNQWAGIYESSVDSDRSRLIRLPDDDDDDDAVDDESRLLLAPPPPAGHRASASDSE